MGEPRQGAVGLYLTTADWAEGDNPAAEPWSAPAEAYPAFEPGTHLALISYGVEGFHRTRSGDEKAFDMTLNTRLFKPIMPVRYTNEILRGRNEYLRGLRRRLEANFPTEGPTGCEEMLYRFGGRTYKLPVEFWAFAARNEPGERGGSSPMTTPSSSRPTARCTIGGPQPSSASGRS